MRELLLALLCVGCVQHFEYKPPQSSSLKSATNLSCVVLPPVNQTNSQYASGWPCAQCKYTDAAVDADAEKIVVNLLASGNLCGQLKTDASPAWNNDRREQLFKAGNRVAARLILDRMVVDLHTHWWVFINPLSLLGLLGVPTIAVYDKADLSARLDLIDLATGEVAFSFAKEAGSSRDLYFSSYTNSTQATDALNPAWREWGQQALAALDKEATPKLVALERGESLTPNALPASAVQLSGRLAVLEFRSRAKEDIDVVYFSDLVRGKVLAKAPRVNVMTRENLLVLLQSTGRSAADCEGECEVDTGRRIGADYVITGDVSKLGKTLKLTLKLHDTHSGRLLGSAIASGADQETLEKGTISAMDTLFHSTL